MAGNEELTLRTRRDRLTYCRYKWWTHDGQQLGAIIQRLPRYSNLLERNNDLSIELDVLRPFNFKQCDSGEMTSYLPVSENTLRNTNFVQNRQAIYVERNCILRGSSPLQSSGVLLYHHHWNTSLSRKMLQLFNTFPPANVCEVLMVRFCIEKLDSNIIFYFSEISRSLGKAYFQIMHSLM